MDALCTKIDLRFGDVNRRVENLEKLVIRVGLLEQNKSFTSGSRHWSDYIITIGLSFLVFLLGHYILKY